MDEMDVREWFKTTELEQARDTFRVVEGILEMRGTGRKRRKDAGTKREPSHQQIIEAINEDGQ